MVLKTELSVDEVMDVLIEKVNHPPRWLECLFTFNLAYWWTNSSVCGRTGNRSFEIRRNSGHHFSATCRGVVCSEEGMTMLHLSFSHGWLGRLYEPVFPRYEKDKRKILEFLFDNLGAQ